MKNKLDFIVEYVHRSVSQPLVMSQRAAAPVPGGSLIKHGAFEKSSFHTFDGFAGESSVLHLLLFCFLSQGELVKHQHGMLGPECQKKGKIKQGNMHFICSLRS